MRADLSAIAKKYGILLALQFGSLVTGKTHSRSDVDIAVLVQRSEISFQKHADLLNDVQQLFPGREVDRIDEILAEQYLERMIGRMVG